MFLNLKMLPVPKFLRGLIPPPPAPSVDAFHERAQWRVEWKIDKYSGDHTAEAIDAGKAGKPFETVIQEDNLLMNGGISCLFQSLIGNGTGTGGASLTYFNNTNAAIGVGDSATAEAATQTDLQAASNKLRVAMDATYPLHTDGTTSGAASIVFRSTFGSAQANYAWAEFGVFNSPTAATGRMLNRKVAANGTKASGATWQMTVTITLS